MEKQACHVEWCRLQMKGRPIMTGAAIGSSQLLWVACRALPCLVHIFQDSRLVWIWRFPSDPTFLLFNPSLSSRGREKKTVELDMLSENKSPDATLLAITSDGRIWLLPFSTIYAESTERAAKMSRETIPGELQKAVLEILPNEIDDKPSSAIKASQRANQNHIELVDSDMENPKQDMRKIAHKLKDGRSTHARKTTHESSHTTDKSSGLMEFSTRHTKIDIAVASRDRNKQEVRSVPQTALLDTVPGVSIAAFGPRGSVALLAASRVLKVIQVSSNDLSRGPTLMSHVLPVQCDSPSTDWRPTCLLYASVLVRGKSPELPERTASVLDEKLFRTIFGEPDKLSQDHKELMDMLPLWKISLKDLFFTSESLLESERTVVCKWSSILIRSTNLSLPAGDAKGEVYSTSLSPSDPGISCSRVLCDFSQPIVAILSVPPIISGSQMYNQRGNDRDHKMGELQSHSLLIIGQLGRVILITGVRERFTEGENGPFWPSSATFSWRCVSQSSTARQLNERNLIHHEWELNSPISAACMLGPHRLCYCSRAEILYTDLFEMLGGAKTLPQKSLRAGNPSRAGQDPMPFSNSNITQKLSVSGPSVQSTTEDWTLRKELLSHTVAVADVVMDIAGRGVFGGMRSSRPLVALTTRGRLLGVEVSNHISNRASTFESSLQKNWRSSQSRMEERVQELLQIVADVAESTNVLKSHNSCITLALNDLAIALQLADEICSDKTRNVPRRPDSNLNGETPVGKLWSSLTVRDQTPGLISPKKLSFGTSKENLLGYSGNVNCRVKIAIKLSNHSQHAVSPYWSLLLELRTINSDKAEVVHSSIVINKGLGLPVGADFTEEIILQLPGKSFNPVLASIFLCHLHDPHHSVATHQPSKKNLTQTYHKKPRSDPFCPLVDAIDSKLETCPAVDIPDKANMENLNTRQTSGAALILLSTYRLDLLSLLQVPPPQVGVLSWTHQKLVVKSNNFGEDLERKDLQLATFSGKINLTCSKNSIHLKDIAGVWQELYLEDLLSKEAKSQALQTIVLSASDVGTISICLEYQLSGESTSSITLQLQATSLLLGSLAREAILWRLGSRKTKFLSEEIFPGQRPCPGILLSKAVPKTTSLTRDADQSKNSSVILEEDCGDAPKHPRLREMSSVVSELGQRLTGLSAAWKDVMASRDSLRFASLLEDAELTIQDVTRTYMTYREDRRVLHHVTPLK